MGPDHRDPRFTGVLKFIYATAAIVGATALCGMYVKASNMSDDLIVLKTNQGNQNNQLSRVETEQLEQRRALDDVNRRLITLEARSNDARR